jgi:hypothetical protein
LIELFLKKSLKVFVSPADTSRARAEEAEGANMEQVTHYTDEANKLFCLDPECHAHAHGEIEASNSEASDYDDYDCCGADLTCASCSEYLFPKAQAEREAEHRHMESLYRSGQLGRMIGRADKLAALQASDPVAFYINCKDNPDAIEEALESM